ncbi:hypothetical protein [Shewanella phaeophyticola]|uniref:Uncharacterized protein n=1 Tax=Shewanella phaeophyticola TaxID=2978345 RepID=A0ABT2P0P7_9GAMM|nr:hypothetical protein [Shewanella sp. KJ10-1]MCT8986233.1 hypothetical protein [Shewanella sp. KJ10-1]
MPSTQLQMRYPLLSDEMYGLAEVNYAGESANSTQKAYIPNDVAEFFANDLANDDYAYSSTREDVAMLFEEIMMSHRYSILRDIAITDKPEVQTSSTITVEWANEAELDRLNCAIAPATFSAKCCPALTPNSLWTVYQSPLR